MANHIRFAAAVIGAALLIVVGAGRASATPLACDSVTPEECRITTLRTLGSGGTFEVDRALHIVGPSGELRVNPGAALVLNVAGGLTIDVGGRITGTAGSGSNSGASIDIRTGGAVVLAGNGVSGALISSDQAGAGGCSGGTGGAITITSTFTSASASITTQSGSRITANARCSAGEITILATHGGVDIRGLVESASALSGTGAKQAPGGGPITISASCNLTINDTGQVSSRGNDPGGNLVHLEAGSDLLVIGMVESTGTGHAVPNTPANRCAGLNRPDKPATSTACVELWAGKNLVIDSSASNNGQINADLSRGGANRFAWIDIFAKRDISISGSGDGPYAANASPYAVHANQTASNAAGGIITVKSLKGQIDLSGQAIQADGPQTLGGAGGLVVIEAGGANANAGRVDLGAASVRARGANSGGGPQAGGDIAIRSFGGQILGVAPGELSASGGAGKLAPEPGTITLRGCNGVPPAVSYGGAAAPAAGTLTPSCGGKPTLPTYVVFPASACDAPPCTGPNCPPPPCEGPNCPCTGPNCPPPPCEGPNCPCTGPNCPPPPCEGPNCPCTGPNCPCVGAGCGPYTNFCTKGSVQAVLNPLTGRFPGNRGADRVVDVRTQSLQAALDSATDTNGDGYIIVGVVARDGGAPGGSGSQEINVSRAYGQPFALIGCGVTLRDPLACDGHAPMLIHASATSPELPVGSGVTLYVQEITVTSSQTAPGWVVSGNGRFLEAVGSIANRAGITIVGDRNTIRNSFARDNYSGAGIWVQGKNNMIDTFNATNNANGDGITVTGNRNTIVNSTSGGQGVGNGGGGISVNGAGNLMNGNAAFGNGGDGFSVGGGTAASPNILKGNVAGGAYRGNGANGFVVSGIGTGASKPTELEANTAQSNHLGGFKVTGSGHQLKGNVSGGSGGTMNSGCQYEVSPGNIRAGGNTSNSVSVPGVNGSAFPIGCF